MRLFVPVLGLSTVPRAMVRGPVAVSAQVQGSPTGEKRRRDGGATRSHTVTAHTLGDETNVDKGLGPLPFSQTKGQ